MRAGSTFAAECAAGALLFPAAPALLGAVLVLAREVRYGPCWTWDSSQYIAAARSLAAGEGFVGVVDPFTGYPPLYPLLTAAAGALLRIDPLDVAGPLNAAVFGLTVFVFGRYLRRRLDSRFAAVWACTVLSLSFFLSEAASQIMSDSPFILVTTLALIETDNFLTAGKRRSLAAAAAWGALAALTRYIGAVVPIFTGLALLLRQGAPPQRRAREAAVFLSAACLPAALWILRNYLFFDTFTGPGGQLRFEMERPRPLLQVLRTALVFLLEWTHLEPAWAAAAVLGAITAAVAFASRRRGQRAHAAQSASWVWAGFALTYFVSLVAVISVGYAPSLQFNKHRYLLPLWIPLLAAAAFALDRFLSSRRERKCGGRGCRPAAAAFMAALCLWTAGQAAANARRISQLNADEYPFRYLYNAPSHAGFEMLRYIEALPSADPLGGPLSGIVYSNLPYALSMYNRARATYRFLSREPRYPPPAPTRPDVRPDAGQKRALASLADAPHGAWVVWLESEYYNNLAGYGAAWLSTLPNLEPVMQTADGAVFKVNTGAPPRPNPYRAALRAADANPGAANQRAANPGAQAASQAGFNVYWRGKELVYIKQDCSEQDARTHFFLHVWPQDEAVLAADRKPHGMDNLDFLFRKYGVVLDGACVAVRPLPDYAAARIRTGQYAPERGALWQTELRAAPDGAAGVRD